MQGKGRIAFAISREGKSSTYSGISLFCEGEKKGLSSEKRMATEKSRVSKEKKKERKALEKNFDCGRKRLAARTSVVRLAPQLT